MGETDVTKKIEETKRAIESASADEAQDAFDASLYRAKKKKARLRRKRRIQALVLVVVLMAGAGAYRYYSIKQAEKAAAADSTVEILVEEGQSVIYAQIDEIYGNEMTYTILKEVETTEGTDGTEYTETVMNTSYASGSDSVILTTAGMGGFPGGGSSGGGFPGGDFSGGPDSSGGFNPFGSSSQTDDDTVTIGGVTYEPGDTQETVLIPVGTSVTTKLGAETTFSRLSAGNAIAMVMQDNEIVRIYIVG